ncbi:S8 family serine peptidase [Actinoplanes derwentensis]|uniref:Subtilase family protein n=1 Tax=Actinoplanes derwentensis TaxID=113562 RepID=A0A1H1X5V1_9ACTN|nr:S8 family serine peptidase [Actinoplanes derwentensis]GID85726.1 serine protease [Actinoplanes derwentensis]SDT04006.1 Subtilase family protein [Actinoplanes derwentensis]
MRRPSVPAVLLGITTVVLGSTVAGNPAAAIPPEKPENTTATTATERAATAKPVTVTLITGDEVTVRAGGRPSVRPAPGREKVGFVSSRAGGRNLVVPRDALPLLTAGRLDERLFDIDTLVGFGYTDDRTTELPLLIAYPDKGADQARTTTVTAGTRVTRDLPAAGVLAVSATATGRSGLWQQLTQGTQQARALKPAVANIWLDGKRDLVLDHSVPQIGAPTAWAAGYDGTGVKVAVLDTGIDADHPDLAGKVAEAADFTGSASGTDDVEGHGTHVASTIAGTGAASGGKYKGVAPGAGLVIGKVCGDLGCTDSAILAGMEWAASRAEVVNMSLGGGDTAAIDPLEAAINNLTEQYGTLFVVASGNAGTFAPVSSPSTADAALSVGAVDREDQLAEFSSRGPRTGDGAVKPEITAPGVEIVAARAGGTTGEDAYVAYSGTSMATPHVVGAAAILAQQHPDWTAQQRKTVLMGSAAPIDGTTAYQQGAGRVDVAREITQTVAVNEGAINFGIQRWPHDDDQPVTKTVTYRNEGTAAVTLTLALTGQAGVFTVADTTLTVPAGGTATTTVTADTRGDLPDQPLSGHLIGTGPGGVRVSAPLGVVREVESYDVEVDVVEPVDFTYVVLVELNSGEFAEWLPGGGTLRLPKGEYAVAANVETDATSAWLYHTRFAVTGDRTLTLDARDAKPIAVTVPDPAAAISFIGIAGEWDAPAGWVDLSFAGFDPGNASIGQIWGAPADNRFLGSVTENWARPGADGLFTDSPVTYDQTYFKKGSQFTGLKKRTRTGDYAALRTTYHVDAVGAGGIKANGSQLGESLFWTPVTPISALPFQRTEYVNADTGSGTWLGFFNETGPELTLSSLQSEPKKYQPGRTYQDPWNKAVIAHTVTGSDLVGGHIVRSGDTVLAAPPNHGDGVGHYGFTGWDSARTALYRNGELVAEEPSDFGFWEVPAESATYRLETSVDRGTQYTYSTKFSTAWTFVSGHTSDEEWTPLPITTVRFDPPVDATGKARAGKTVKIPVHLDQQITSRARAVTTEVSYDDGRTWRRVPVTGSGIHRTVTITHPATAGFVSLRATATTANGTAEQTVIRAYAIG